MESAVDAFGNSLDRRSRNEVNQDESVASSTRSVKVRRSDLRKIEDPRLEAVPKMEHTFVDREKTHLNDSMASLIIM